MSARFGPDNLVLLNPRLPGPEKRRLRGLAARSELKGHIFLLASGSTAAGGGRRWVALSKAAARASAEAVNRHLRVEAADVWLHVLPEFHAGGLGVRLRAELAGAGLRRMEEWDAARFAALAEGASLSALVPAQLHDLVRRGLRAAASLRAIVVGGGALEPELYAEARSLGWPALPSYGLTETASQIATASLASLDETGYPSLELLDHAEAKAAGGELRVRGASLLTAYLAEGHRSWDPKDADGWFATGDLGAVEGRALRVSGRVDEVTKIGGESVDFAALRRRLAGLVDEPRLTVAAKLDERLGHVVELVAEIDVPARELDAARAAFDAASPPYERIRAVRRIDRLPRTELGKLKLGELAAGEPPR